MQTEVSFALPKGYVDAGGAVHQDGTMRLRGAGGGAVHQDGTMRLATARDEIEPLRDPEVRQNEAYLTVLLLSRVVTRIGGVDRVTPAVIEGLYAADFDHLQRLYERLNTDGEAVGSIT